MTRERRPTQLPSPELLARMKEPPSPELLALMKADAGKGISQRLSDNAFWPEDEGWELPDALLDAFDRFDKAHAGKDEEAKTIAKKTLCGALWPLVKSSEVSHALLLAFLIDVLEHYTLTPPLGTKSHKRHKRHTPIYRPAVDPTYVSAHARMREYKNKGIDAKTAERLVAKGIMDAKTAARLVAKGSMDAKTAAMLVAKETDLDEAPLYNMDRGQLGSVNARKKKLPLPVSVVHDLPEFAGPPEVQSEPRKKRPPTR